MTKNETIAKIFEKVDEIRDLYNTIEDAECEFVTITFYPDSARKSIENICVAPNAEKIDLSFFGDGHLRDFANLDEPESSAFYENLDTFKGAGR